MRLGCLRDPKCEAGKEEAEGEQRKCDKEEVTAAEAVYRVDGRDYEEEINGAKLWKVFVKLLLDIFWVRDWKMYIPQVTLPGR